MGDCPFTRTVEENRDVWLSPGEYLQRSTLVILARNISGCELPASALDDKTFEAEEDQVTSDVQNAVDTLGSISLRDAYIASVQAGTDDADVTDDDYTTAESDVDDLR